MQKLTDTFGYCVIPKNTFLFRGHADKSFDDCMFFTTKHWVAAAFHDSIQIWKTTTDIQVLFLVEYLTDSSWTISALPRLYNNIFPSDSNPNFDDLDIKHWDINRRNKLIRKLFDEHKISGWLTSLENKVEIEVCLFDKHANARQLILADITDRKDEQNIKDSLQRIKFSPPNYFYTQTEIKLNEHTTIETDRQSSYNRHRRFVNAGIKDYVERGMTENEAKHHMLDLRTKLKI